MRPTPPRSPRLRALCSATRYTPGLPFPAIARASDMIIVNHRAYRVDKFALARQSCRMGSALAEPITHRCS
jgi:hypothetical protein